ncbi:MAG: tryptophan 2,3-dioxygenase family protein [Gemmatimonadetes bacterium]|nr:tryptophan 2,3-dioxygenase family protein [Gemmatimonadota bacterium]
MAFGLTGAAGEPRLSYASYLRIPELLRLQHLESDPPQHDELLFIIIHQVYELWFRQLLHELDAVIACLDGNDVLGAHRLTRRCIEVQRVLIEQVNILETMTPNDFLTFRDHLMPASGFQSAQFRAIEFLCGLKNAAHLEHYEAGSEQHALLEQRLNGPTLGERFHALLGRRGFDMPVSSATEPSGEEAVERRTRELLRIYQDPRSHYDLFLLAEALIEFDEMFYLWRLRHIAMVERMIGAKPGTGGSEGVTYLRGTLNRKFFPELWALRTRLGAHAAPGSV